MLISDVEHKVGLSKKSIRFYEENGLLTITRNQTNDYRLYTEEDLHKLKIIKFLRELGVSIRELKMLNDGTLSLTDCMSDRIKKITEEEKNYIKLKEMCEEIKEKNYSFNNIDIEKYFNKINTFNKEGFTMRNLKTSKKRKIRGAMLSSSIFSLFFIFIVTIISYFQFTEPEKMPWIVYMILMLLLLMPVIGIVYNLIIRIREINGGEEDEASKYWLYSR